MKERKADLFETIHEDGVDAICITTNGLYTTDGKAAMGGGCAGVCARRWPQTSERLGSFLKTFGSFGSGNNVPYVIGCLDADAKYITPTKKMMDEKTYHTVIFSFPTIDNLMDGAKMSLVKRSAEELVKLVDRFGLKNVIVPRPGVGIGGLSWDEVKSVIEPIFDDRFTIVSFEHEVP